MNASPFRNTGFSLFLLVFLCPLAALAQDITGIWRGYFITDAGEQYKYELQISHSKTNRISGVSYSYLDTRFYGKATLTGNYVKAGNSALVQEIKTVEVKMSGGSTACIMKCRFVYSTSGKEQFLEGNYTSSFEEGSERGQNCGGGRVMLRKVTTSDFYIEPFLKNKPSSVPPARRPVETPRPPAPKPPVQKPKPSSPPATVIKPGSSRPATDTAKRRPQVINTLPKPETKPVVIAPVPTETRDRRNELVKLIEVRNEEITIKLYDNGEVDGDTISVYLDGKTVVSNRGLSTQAITVKLKLDESNPEHTLVMVAENLGRIPPNTALMIVNDGEQRFEVSITSTEQKNAMVRFRYRK